LSLTDTLEDGTNKQIDHQKTRGGISGGDRLSPKGVHGTTSGEIDNEPITANSDLTMNGNSFVSTKIISDDKKNLRKKRKTSSRSDDSQDGSDRKTPTENQKTANASRQGGGSTATGGGAPGGTTPGGVEVKQKSKGEKQGLGQPVIEITKPPKQGTEKKSKKIGKTESNQESSSSESTTESEDEKQVGTKKSKKVDKKSNKKDKKSKKDEKKSKKGDKKKSNKNKKASSSSDSGDDKSKKKKKNKNNKKGLNQSHARTKCETDSSDSVDSDVKRAEKKRQSLAGADAQTGQGDFCMASKTPVVPRIKGSFTGSSQEGSHEALLRLFQELKEEEDWGTIGSPKETRVHQPKPPSLTKFKFSTESVSMDVPGTAAVVSQKVERHKSKKHGKKGTSVSAVPTAENEVVEVKQTGGIKKVPATTTNLNSSSSSDSMKKPKKVSTKKESESKKDKKLKKDKKTSSSSSGDRHHVNLGSGGSKDKKQNKSKKKNKSAKKNLHKKQRKISKINRKTVAYLQLIENYKQQHLQQQKIRELVTTKYQLQQRQQQGLPADCPFFYDPFLGQFYQCHDPTLPFFRPSYYQHPGVIEGHPGGPEFPQGGYIDPQQQPFTTEYHSKPLPKPQVKSPKPSHITTGSLGQPEVTKIRSSDGSRGTAAGSSQIKPLPKPKSVKSTSSSEESSESSDQFNFIGRGGESTKPLLSSDPSVSSKMKLSSTTGTPSPAPIEPSNPVPSPVPSQALVAETPQQDQRPRSDTQTPPQPEPSSSPAPQPPSPVVPTEGEASPVPPPASPTTVEEGSPTTPEISVLATGMDTK